jgi:predicted dehydrogenase
MLRIGLLGAARIAPKAVISPARSRDDVAVTAVAARDLAKAQAFAAEHDVATAVEGYDALIGRDDVDLVYNALPPAAHLHWTLKALAAGKAVLCEKPFAMTADEARAMVAAAESAGRPLIEAFHYRFHPMILQAVQIVRSGVLGRVTSAEGVLDVSIPHRPGELRWIAGQGGGALMDLGCYPLHALRTLLNAEPQVRSATARIVDGVDAATAAELDFGGVPARLHCDMQADERRCFLQLNGERGRLEVEGFVHPYREGSGLRLTLDEARTWEPGDPTPTYAFQMGHVVEVMAGRAAPLTGGADAVATMAAMDAIRAAS